MKRDADDQQTGYSSFFFKKSRKDKVPLPVLELKDETVLKNPLLKNLNRIAWLLQSSSTGCVAVGLVGKKWLIADNDIFGGTDNDHKNVTFIRDSLFYLSQVARVKNVKDEETSLSLKRIALVKRIFQRKFVGEAKGYLKPAEAYQDQIFAEIEQILTIMFAASTSTEAINNAISISQHRLRKGATHSFVQVAGAFELGLLILRRLKGIEKKLLFPKTKADHSLKTGLAALEGQGRIVRYSKFDDIACEDDTWICNSDEIGYALIAITAQVEGIHAELKLIDFLLASRLWHEDSKVQDSVITVGISKACCLYCSDAIKFTNEAIIEKRLLTANPIQVGGAHYRGFDGWNASKPPFLVVDEADSEHFSVFEKSETKDSGQETYSSGSPSTIHSEESKHLESEENSRRVYFISEEGDRVYWDEREKINSEYSITYYRERSTQLSHPICQAFMNKHPIHHVEVYHSYTTDSSERNETVSGAHLKAYLLQECEPKTFLIYYNEGAGQWMFLGTHYLSGKIEHHILDTKKYHITRRGDLKKEDEKKFIAMARKALGYDVDVPKSYLSQESEHTSSFPGSPSDTVDKVKTTKSTLAELLYDIQEGSVLIDDGLVELIKKLFDEVQQKKSNAMPDDHSGFFRK